MKDNFRGTVVDRELWVARLDGLLNYKERDILSLIHNYHKPRKDGSVGNCYMTNRELAELVGCSELRIQRAIDNLQKKGRLRIEMDGTRRLLFTILKREIEENE